MAKRTQDSIGSILFLIRNVLDFEGCRNYVKKLLDYYEFNNYEIKLYERGMSALFITINEIDYIVYFDIKYICLKVISSKDDFKRWTEFQDASCWRDSLQYILKDCEVKWYEYTT